MPRPTKPRVPRGFRPQRAAGIDRVIGVIQEWAVLRKVRPHAIALALNMAPGTLRKMMRPSWNPSARTLRKVDKFMQYLEQRGPDA